MSYPYAYSNKNLKSFLTEVSSRGIPDSIDGGYLVSVGYSNKTDVRIISIMKFLKLLNKDGTTNENYENFRDASKSSSLMASLIRQAYENLYKDFPDAHTKENKSLTNWFKTKMGVSENTARYAAYTFKTLGSFADFKSEEKLVKVEKVEKEVQTREEILEEAKKLISIEETTPGLVINVNIQLALPATENVDVYDKIFKSLKENILKRDD